MNLLLSSQLCSHDSNASRLSIDSRPDATSSRGKRLLKKTAISTEDAAIIQPIPMPPDTLRLGSTVFLHAQI